MDALMVYCSYSLRRCGFYQSFSMVPAVQGNNATWFMVVISLERYRCVLFLLDFAFWRRRKLANKTKKNGNLIRWDFSSNLLESAPKSLQKTVSQPSGAHPTITILFAENKKHVCCPTKHDFVRITMAEIVSASRYILDAIGSATYFLFQRKKTYI